MGLSVTRCFFVGGSLLTRFSACSFARSSTLPWMSDSLAFLPRPCSWEGVNEGEGVNKEQQQLVRVLTHLTFAMSM